MRRRLFLLLTIVALLAAARADEKTGRANALFLRADNAENIRQPDSPPFRLQAKLRLWAHGKSFEGTYLLQWKDEEHWRGELRIGDFEQVEVRRGDDLFRRRSVPFVPPRVRDWSFLVKATEPLKEMPTGEWDKVKSLSARSGPGGPMACVRTQENTEYCFDDQHGWMVSKTTPNEEGRYDDFQPFGDKSYPRHQQLNAKKRPIAEMQITALDAAADLPDSLWTPPAGAEQWPTCEHMEHARPINTPNPQYTDAARRAGVQGEVALTVKIGADGQVERAAVSRSVEPSLDEAVRQAVLGWTFTPARCGSTPVPSEINIEVNFRLYR